MKDARFASVLTVLICGLALPMYALGSITSLPEPKVAGSVAYLSGGIGQSEAAMMRNVAKDYQLEIVFIQKLKTREELLAGIHLQVQDSHRDLVLDIVTDGPYLLANLPQGKYLVTAERNGDVKEQWVNVDTKKHQKVVFWWPISD